MLVPFAVLIAFMITAGIVEDRIKNIQDPIVVEKGCHKR